MQGRYEPYIVGSPFFRAVVEQAEDDSDGGLLRSFQSSMRYNEDLKRTFSSGKTSSPALAHHSWVTSRILSNAGGAKKTKSA